jgi:DUF1680 family protein
VRISVDPDEPAEFTLKLRIPGWSRGATVTVNGASVNVGENKNGYVEIRRPWSAGDVVALDLPMPIERIYAHPEVKADIGKVAIKRGPLVYCFEHVDNGGILLERARLPRDAELEAASRPELFDGVVAVAGKGRVAAVADWSDDLYRQAPPRETAANLLAIPYYLWCNRGPGRMMVWIPEA